LRRCIEKENPALNHDDDAALASTFFCLNVGKPPIHLHSSRWREKEKKKIIRQQLSTMETFFPDIATQQRGGGKLFLIGTNSCAPGLVAPD